MDKANPDVLRRALDRLRLHGLVKNRLEDPATGAVCVIGALDAVTGGDDNWMRSCDLLDRVATEQFPDRTRDGNVIAFNNHPDTTQDDVERVFEKAIVEAGGSL